ncbi:MAG TPA: hypothetical protein DDW52_27080 [Planctomycetaceae bacterium]|nr:hypothetical protein [Planctomycetaceae bacterium]
MSRQEKKAFSAITIRELLVFTSLMALASASVVSSHKSLHFVLALLIIAYLASTTVEALVLTGEPRKTAMGAAVFGWSYIGTLRFSGAAAMFDEVLPTLGLDEVHREYFVLSARSLLALPLMMIGRLLASRLGYRSDSRADV